MTIRSGDFTDYFQACHGQPPFDWQTQLAEMVLSAGWPPVLSLPTAAGKTAVLDVAVFALAVQAALPPGKRTAPRRMVFVVDRRIVVDATAQRARRIAAALNDANNGILASIRDALLRYGGETPLCCSELRGGIWRNERWTRTPLQPTVLVSTVDQVGSRLLHRGYGLSPSAWPIHAGLLANDALVVLDEAHLSRAFEDTLGWIKRYRSWAETPLALPFHVVRMSATPHSGERAFPIDQSLVFGDSRLSPRLTMPKLTSLLRVEKARKLPHRCVEAALKMASAGRTVAVIVNRVATARNVHEQLVQPASRKRNGFAGSAILLTGRCRPLERDRLLSQYNERLPAGRNRAAQADAPPFIVVATQCVEAGADFDFDGLVTECAPLDSLLQRFGRLNRIGALPSAEAVIVGSPDMIKGKEDAVYGLAASETWAWLNSQQETSPLDFSSAALKSRLPTDTSKLAAPTVTGPLVFPEYCNIWSQTSPVATPSPAPAVFLHGPQRGEPDVQVVWRADLDPERLDTWLEALALSPPGSAEALPVRVSAARAWLATTKTPKDGSDADVEGLPLTEEWSSTGGTPKPFLIWRGIHETDAPDTDVTRLRPGDTIVVPATHGGCDAYGWNPTSTAIVTDITEQARLHAGRPVQLRLHRALAASWGESAAPELLQIVDTLDTADDTRAVANQVFAAVAKLPDGAAPDWLRNTCRFLVDSDSKYILLKRGDGAWVALSSRRWSREAADFDDGDDYSAANTPVRLDRHLADVEAQVCAFANNAGLPSEVYEALRCAAAYHDRGKADPRFQALLCGGDRAMAIRAERHAGGPLAKSPQLPRSPAARAEARRRSGYPEGGRHELVSVRLLEADGVPATADADLALHAVAAHHGGCRPFAPSVHDAAPLAIQWPPMSNAPSVSSNSGLDALDSGVSERFWRLVRRYGWWGLSYLEAVLRLADHRVSERYEKGENA